MRVTLLAVRQYLEANDLAKSQLHMQEAIRYSPLTLEVAQRTERIKGILADHLVKQHFASEDEVVTTVPPAEGEELEPLPDSPLGSEPMLKAPPIVAEDAERID